jgi:hypothetical protein
MNQLTNLKYFILIPLVLACFTLSPTTQAGLKPPPDGGYPHGNTAEGNRALDSLTTATVEVTEPVSYSQTVCLSAQTHTVQFSQG